LYTHNTETQNAHHMSGMD